jgi:hypothetical protein
MPYFVFGLIALLLALVAMQGFSRASPAVLARNIRWGAGLAALGGAFVLLIRGAVSLAMPLGALGTWLLWHQGPGHPWSGRGSSGQNPNRTSGVTTKFLEMHLDHSTGAMEGRVLEGTFSGRELSSLRPVELAQLWQEYRWTDPASAQLVEAYLDRSYPAWREDMAQSASGTGERSSSPMTRREALDILGLDDTADADAIRHAHRTLMAKLHPDRGGSTYLAAKINQAKDVALGRG